MSRILITNGGPHSAEKWAMTTAETIFPLDDTTLIGERLIMAQKFQIQLAEVLANHHGSVMEDEKENLHDVEHYAKPLDAKEYLDHVMEEVLAASENTPWKAHFANPELQQVVREAIENHFMTAQHIERLWHAQQNDSHQGKHYLAVSHQGPVEAAAMAESPHE